MFDGCTSFNQSLNDWDVHNVISMVAMFYNCEKFNQNISSWDVRSVRDTKFMFNGCKNFNQDISNWNVSNVENMEYMFEGCSRFNQQLTNWDIRKVERLSEIFDDTLIQDFDFLRSWLPIRVDIKGLKRTFGEDLPLEWLIIKGVKDLKDLTEEEYKNLHPNCKNYLKYTIVDF